jgi:hypothetical protein
MYFSPDVLLDITYAEMRFYLNQKIIIIIELPFARVKTTDQRIAPARSQHCRPQAACNRTCPTSTESRKGKPWEPDEINLLVKLKEGGLPWSMIAERFGEQFLGRSQGTMQVYWS